MFPLAVRSSALLYCLCLSVGRGESNGLKATFVPKRISSRINSTAVVSISLLWTDDQPFSHLAKLNTSSGDPLEITPFEFNNEWKANVSFSLSRVGRFVYFVQLFDDERSEVKDVQGSLVISVYRKCWVDTLAVVTGWTYFVLWSVSFYPQVLLNYMRKSVVGLSFDFILINLIGFLSYSLFNCFLYFPGIVQKRYSEQYPHSPIPVESNDVAFAIHASVLCVVVGIQCLLMESGSQRVTKLGFTFASSVSLALLISFIVSMFRTVLILVYAFSYVKLASSLVKYVPQAYLNFQRKSTSGWSISNILLDFSGGLLNFLQQILLSLNYGTLSIIFGNVAKLALGITSILFDIIFITQHYVLYREYEAIPDSQQEDCC